MINQHDIVKSELLEVILEPGDDYGFILKKTTTLYVVELPGAIMVLWPTLNAFGSGPDVPTAVTELLTYVVRIHDFLRNTKLRLSPGLRKTLAQFDEVISAPTNDVS